MTASAHSSCRIQTLQAELQATKEQASQAYKAAAEKASGGAEAEEKAAQELKKRDTEMHELFSYPAFSCISVTVASRLFFLLSLLCASCNADSYPNDGS